MEKALKLAQERAALPIERHGLGLRPDNTPAERAAAMGAIDYLHGTDRLDRFLSSRLPDPKRATSGPMPFGTDSPELASRYAEGKADTSLRLNDEGNIANYFQVMPRSMGLRGKTPINVEQAWHFLRPEKKAEILDKAPRIGYANPAEAEGAWTLHPTVEGAPSSKEHWDYMLKREAKGNPLSALRAIFAESGTLDPYAPTELSDIYKLAGFPYEITQTNAPCASAKGVFTGKAMISNPLNTSDLAALQDTVVPFLKEQFKNDRTRLKLGVDPWDKRAHFTPRDWVNQLEADLSEGKNSFVWTSIPDKVTAQLEKLGYNGILDTGGKMGGAAHQVVIPFRPDQVRSKFAAFDPWRKDAATAAALGLAAPDLLAAEPEEYARGGLVGLADKYLPRMMSIFSGGGTAEHALEGMVRRAGAVEINPEIAQHYERVHGGPVANADVRDIDFRPMAGEVDYLHASPSCTNYSSAGCRVESPIDLMTADATARAIRDIRPPLFTLENVPAYQGRQAFRKIADELNEQGYNWDIVRHNAADLGAPSIRNRMMVRAMLGGELPPAQQYFPKPGDWFPAIEDQIDLMRPSELAPWQLKRLAERGIDPANPKLPLLVGGGTGFKGEIPLAFAGRPGITVLASPVQVDRVVLPGGDVRALNGRSYARLLGLSDSYPLPDDHSLAKRIVGNGMAPAMTREVVGPLISEGLRSILKKYE